jgi:hypothetical protein
MEEIWKDIEDYEGMYQVSNLGNVKSLPRKRTIKKERLLKPAINNKGYKMIVLCKKSKPKMFLVHRLVATAFIPNPNNYPQVNHKDSNPLNNCVNNLEWCTQQENIKYSWDYGNNSKYRNTIAENTDIRIKRYKHTIARCSKKVFQYNLLGEYLAEYNSITEASQKNNINLKHISNCCRGIRKSCGNFQWSFIKEEKLKEYKRNTRNKKRKNKEE